MELMALVLKVAMISDVGKNNEKKFLCFPTHHFLYNPSNFF